MPRETKPQVKTFVPRQRAAAAGDGRGLLYTTREKCPVCGESFSATRVAMSRLRIESREADFYVKYLPLDPNWYQIWICPACGYAAPQGVFAPLYPDEKEKLAARALVLRQRGWEAVKETLPPPLAVEEGSGGAVSPGAEKTFEQVLAEYGKALYFSRPRRRAHGIAGGLYLRLAWMHRREGRTEEDRAFLALAAEEYRQAYEGEDGLPGNMDGLTASYLLGVLYFKLGRLREAARYLGQVIGAREAGDPAIRKLARDQWHELQGVWGSESGEGKID